MIDATVIVAAWRAEKTLVRAIESALAQDGLTLEVIVADDASTDGTHAVAQEMAARHARVRVLRLDVNGGPSAARNAAISAARGRWIAVLDADDAMAPGRLARMVSLGESRGADAVYDDFQPVDAEGRPVGATHLKTLGLSAPVRWDLETFIAGCQAEPGRPGLGYLKPVLRREFLRDHGVTYDETLRNGEDFHLIAALLAAGGALWVMPEAGYLYRQAAGSISNRLDRDHACALARADAAFLRRKAPAMTARAEALMRRRIRRFADLATAEAVLQSLRAGHAGTALRALLRRPQATGRLLRQILEGLRRRMV